MKFPKICIVVVLQCLVLRQSRSTPVSYKTYSCPSTIPSTNTHLVFEKVCYEFVTEKKTHWSVGRTDCTSRGGDLVKVSNHAIQYFVYTTLQKLHVGHDDFWIGLYDLNEEGKFIWVDGTPISYSNWGHNEGFGAYHRQNDCIKIDMGDDGLWHDVNCHLVKHPYICQFSAVETVHTVQPAHVITTKTATVATMTTVSPTTTSATTINREYPSTHSTNREYPPSSTIFLTPTQTEVGVRNSCPDFVCNLDCSPNGHVLYSDDCRNCQCKV